MICAPTNYIYFIFYPQVEPESDQRRKENPMAVHMVSKTLASGEHREYPSLIRNLSLFEKVSLALGTGAQRH